MLAKCANPLCSVPFRYLEAGGLFRLENDPLVSHDRQTPEYFWLCRHCSATMSLRLDEAGRIRIVQVQDATPRTGEAVDLLTLDRQRGVLLSRIIFFGLPARRRRERLMGRIHI